MVSITAECHSACQISAAKHHVASWLTALITTSACSLHSFHKWKSLYTADVPSSLCGYFAKSFSYKQQSYGCFHAGQPQGLSISSTTHILINRTNRLFVTAHWPCSTRCFMFKSSSIRINFIKSFGLTSISSLFTLAAIADPFDYFQHKLFLSWYFLYITLNWDLNPMLLFAVKLPARINQVF